MKVDTKQIKSALPIERLLLHYGAQKTSTNQYWCLLHEKGGGNAGHKTPSLVVHTNSQTISCMSQKCFEGDDIFGLVAKMEGLDVKSHYPKIVNVAAQIAGIQTEKNTPRQKLLTYSNLTSEHQHYLKNRGLEERTIENMNLGSSFDHILFLYKDGGETRGYKAKTTISKDRWDEHKRNNPEWLSYYLKGKKPNFWTVSGVQNKKVIYLVAGEYDSAILYQELQKQKLDKDMGVVTMVTGEVSKINQNTIKYFETLDNIEWRIVYDFDDTGLDNMPKRAKELASLDKKVTLFSWDKKMNPNDKSGYDINDYFLENKNIDIFLDPNNFKEVKEEGITIIKLDQQKDDKDVIYSYRVGNFLWDFSGRLVTVKDGENKIVYQKSFNQSIILSDKTQSVIMRDLSLVGIYTKSDLRKIILSLATNLLNDRQPEEETVKEHVEIINRDISLEEIHQAIAKIGITSRELVEIEMAACISCVLDLNVPLWLLVIGNPSAMKTEVLKLFRGVKRVIYLSTMSENAFASGYLPPDGSQPHDLLAGLNNQVLLIRDLTTLFSLNEETVKKLLGDLTSIFDGEFEKFTATRGMVKYKANFPLIACITPAILSKHHNYVNQLGSRFLTFRIPGLNKEESSRGFDIAWSKENRKENIKAAAILISSYCEQVMKSFKEENFPKIEDQEVREWLNDASDFVRRVRGIAITKSETFKNEKEEEITYYDRIDTQIEEPWRALNQLRNHAIALAVLRKKNFVTMEECKTLEPVIRSAAQIDRAEVLNALIDSAGITSNELSKKIDRSNKTTQRKLIELEMLGLVHRYHDPNMRASGKLPWLWALEQGFTKLLSRNTNKIPPSSEFMSQSQEEIDPATLFDKDIETDKNSEESKKGS